MSPRLRLVLSSFLMLFVELAAIRWAGAYVAYLNAFTNLLLLAAFLGIGIGFLRARARTDAFTFAPVALLAFALVVVVLPVEAGNAGGARSYEGPFGLPPLPAWAELPLLFAVTTALLGTVTEGVARTFARFRPLEAYRLDVAGSLAGIVTFAALSFLGAGPLVWALVAAVTLAVLLGSRLDRVGAIALVAFVGLAAVQAVTGGDTWSPYNRIGTTETGDGVAITANGFPHQSVTSIDRLREVAPFYLAPYRRAASLERVLIVGSGAGNDVAAALDAGAGHVDAVEIDPDLVELGRALHPDDPYGDPRVTVHVDDGRAFLERSSATYDLVVFALPQSIAVVGGQSSVRLESYLLTREAIGAARERLAPDGTFALIKGRTAGVYDAFASTTGDVFGRAPCLDLLRSQHGERAVLTVGNSPEAVACPQRAETRPGDEPVATDDHPFPYLRSRTIPSLYVVSMLLVLLASGLAVRVTAGRLRSLRSHLDLFVMGAAFLLLETSNVVRFALLFGTTWLVNALVFFGILASVLAAVEVAERFAAAGDATSAFGANLLGAMVGGVLEYASLATGYRALVIVVGALYVVALVTARTQARVPA